MPFCIRKQNHHGSCSGRFFLGTTILMMVLIGFFAPPVNAFAPPVYQVQQQSLPSSSGLFGVRSALKRGLHKIQKPFRRSSASPEASPASSSSATTTATRSPEYHESTPEWYKTNHHHHHLQRHGVALLTEHEERVIRARNHLLHDRVHHRAALAAAFNRHSPAMFEEHYDHTEMRVGTTLSHHPSESLDEEEQVTRQTSSTPTTSSLVTSNTRVDRRRLNFQSDDPLYRLPPRTTTSMTRLEEEFRQMLSHFSNYSMRDLYALRDPRMRTLVHGVAASADDEAVYRAFEILFEDLVPLRVAGRLVFRRLKGMMESCIQVREEQIAHVVEATGLDARDVEEARIVFFEVASKLNHDVYLTPEQLTATRMFQSIHERLNLESTEALVEKLDRQHNRKIGLEDFLIGLHQCAEDQCELEENECYALEVVHDLLEEIDSMENPQECEIKTAKLLAREAKELKHVMRYNEMVEIFKGWKEQVPWLWDKENPGRKWEVVQGCFVGAENEKVVEALRIVYVDYAPLRVAAEFILALSASLLNLKAEVKQ